MAAKFRKPILNIEGVSPGRIGTVPIETGRRLLKAVLKITATGQVLNEIVDYVEVEVGGKVQRRFTPDEYQAYTGLMGEASSTIYKAQNNTAGSEIHWPIWFREPWRKGFKAGRALAWGTGDVADDEFVIKVKFLSSAHSSVAMEATLEYDNPVDNQGNALAMGEIVKFYEEDISVTGVRKTYHIPRDRGDLVGVHIFDGNIDNVILTVGDVEVRDQEEADMVSDLTAEGMTAQTDVWSLVLDSDDDLQSALRLAGKKNAYLKFEFSDGTPRNIRALLEFVGPRD